jgi:hypothetical protein
MLPERPSNWIDPLGEDQYNAMKSWNLEKHKQRTLEFQVEAANRRLERAKRLQDTAQEPIRSGSDTGHNWKMTQLQIDAANRLLERARLLQNASQGPSGSVSATRIHGNHSLVRSDEAGDSIVEPGEKLPRRARRNKRASFKKRLEKLRDSGILDLTEEDLRGRSVREVVRDVLAGDCTLTATPAVASEREEARASAPGRPLSSVPIPPLSS